LAVVRGLRALLIAGTVAVFAATVVGLAHPFVALAHWAPLLVVIGMLLARRFVGEEKILARMRSRLPVRRPARRRWSHLRERALSSVAERTTQHLRGPPAPIAA
jgi:hypothetical protein